MTAVTRANPERLAAWLRLSSESAAFQRYGRRFAATWGVALLAACAARLMCALYAPVSILGWISTPILTGTSVLAVIVSGAAAVEPITRLVHAAPVSARTE